MKKYTITILGVYEDIICSDEENILIEKIEAGELRFRDVFNPEVTGYTEITEE